MKQWVVLAPEKKRGGRLAGYVCGLNGDGTPEAGGFPTEEDMFETKEEAEAAAVVFAALHPEDIGSISVHKVLAGNRLW